MTTLIKKYKWPALLAVALIVFSALIFFLIKSYTYDSSTYFESRDFIRQLKQSDANWNGKVLRKKIGINNNLSLAPPPRGRQSLAAVGTTQQLRPLGGALGVPPPGLFGCRQEQDLAGGAIRTTQRPSARTMDTL